MSTEFWDLYRLPASQIQEPLLNLPEKLLRWLLPILTQCAGEVGTAQCRLLLNNYLLNRTEIALSLLRCSRKNCCSLCIPPNPQPSQGQFLKGLPYWVATSQKTMVQEKPVSREMGQGVAPAKANAQLLDSFYSCVSSEAASSCSPHLHSRQAYLSSCLSLLLSFPGGSQRNRYHGKELIWNCNVSSCK